jgi:hypothetical protein
MWEALTALGSILSATVIAVTVIMAARQIRVMNDQLEQTRRATQFDAARTVLLDMVDAKAVAAYRFVMRELPNRMKDPGFLRDVGLVGLADDTIHQEIYLLRVLDRIGAYVRFKLVDREIIYSTYHTRILGAWEALGDVVVEHRKATYGHFWGNAQYLYDDCKAWTAIHDPDLDSRAIVQRMRERDAGAS